MNAASDPPPAAGPDSVTLAAARAALAELRPRIAHFLALRADLAELRADLRHGGASALGGRAEAKGYEARMHSELERFAASGAQLKSWAPLLLDWPGTRDGVPVLWCWLEGEDEISWYHRRDAGFPGRRAV